MATTPYFSIGTISERSWRGIGKTINECWVCADTQCVHGVAPWLGLFGSVAYREAAGVPDTRGASLEESLKAIQKLFPSIAPMCRIFRGPFADLDALILAGHPASASVLSATLATKDGKAVPHRIALRAKDAQRQFCNPLDPAYTFPKDCTAASLKKWLNDYPSPAEANAIVFPTVEEAFETHPLRGDCTPQQLAAAKSLGFKEGKAKAQAAVDGIAEA